jgi:alkylation response protein AidB-like acyl-CoA dehydrogenase
MWVPKALGGSELDPVSSLKVIDQLVYADPSTGWVSMAAGLAIGTGGAYLGDRRSRRSSAGERFPVIAGQGTRPARPWPRTAGTLLSGSWQFASGIKHSGFIHTLGVVEGTGEPRIFVLPGRAGDPDRQLGRHGAARDREHRLHDRRRVRARALLALRGDRDPSAAATSNRWGSSTSPASATRDRRSASRGG